MFVLLRRLDAGRDLHWLTVSVQSWASQGACHVVTEIVYMLLQSIGGAEVEAAYFAGQGFRAREASVLLLLTMYSLGVFG